MALKQQYEPFDHGSCKDVSLNVQNKMDWFSLSPFTAILIETNKSHGFLFRPLILYSLLQR